MADKPAIDIEQARRVADLAHLQLGEEELVQITDDLQKILAYVDKLNELDTSAIEPTTHAVELPTRYRDDMPRAGLATRRALENAPEPIADGFGVPNPTVMSELTDKTIVELGQRLESGANSSLEATDACLARIENTQDLGAFLQVDPEGARAQAARADARRSAGERLGPLDGVPLALKDIFLCEGLATTCGSNILKGFVAPYDGGAVRKLKEAGAVILGKLNMDEFAMGSSNEHSAFGVVKNPWDKNRVPGGSSGGSAAAVAAGSTFGALGTDTGGSIRQPASLCGIVGLKPTYGRISRYGVIAFASSLDQVGPMSKDVGDCALLLEQICGHDPNDSTSVDKAVDAMSQTLEKGASGLKLGVPREFFGDGIDPEVRNAVDAAIDTYRRIGAQICEVSLPHTDFAIATYYLLCTAEASSNLARYDGVRYGLRRASQGPLREMYQKTRGEGFGTEVKRRIMLGTYALSAGYYDAYYRKAQTVRSLIRRDYLDALQEVDALISPTAPTAAFALGDNIADPLAMYLADIYTVGCNLAGLPGLSMPCGFTQDGLPIGLQLIGAPWQEAHLLRIARAYERETQWHTRRAPA